LDRRGEDMQTGKIQSFPRDKKALSPAISTVIMTSAVVVMILVAMSFANTMIDSRLAENEFSANKQFMLTTALQIDDVAWTIGRTQTVRYSSSVGNIRSENATLRYTFEVDYGTGSFDTLFAQETGIILFNIPVSSYSLGNGYFQRISTSANGSIIQAGASAPVNDVFCIEKLPMTDGSYARIVVAPKIRLLHSTIGSPLGSTNYERFYLPTLINGRHLYQSQSITLSGEGVTKIIESGVSRVRVTVTSTLNGEAAGFDSNFFKFDQTSETIIFGNNSVVEFYIGKVLVKIGQA
jgi:hypothetical protein